MSGKVGDNLFRASGVVAAADTGGLSWQAVTTASTLSAVAGNAYPINTTSNVCTVSLPAGSAGNEILFVDYAGTWDSYAVTLQANGSEKIKGSTTDGLLNGERESVKITYVDSTQGWISISAANETSPVVSQPAYIAATGPDDAAGETDGDYKFHKFTASKVAAEGFVVSEAGNADGSNTVEYLVVAGGGGGGAVNRAAGAGAGGMLTATGLSVSVASYAITVGGGGAGSTAETANGVNGSNSVFSTITSTGGGGGSSVDTPGGGSDGGSGGGGSTAGGPGEGTTGQGNDGGTGAAAPNYGCGGGGGKEAVGANGSTSNAGADSDITGETIGYAGGGGGGRYLAGDIGTGTDGGGDGVTDSEAGNGTANTGGGGGGATYDGGTGHNGGNGGSGIVVVRYKFQN